MPVKGVNASENELYLGRTCAAAGDDDDHALYAEELGGIYCVGIHDVVFVICMKNCQAPLRTT